MRQVWLGQAPGIYPHNVRQPILADGTPHIETYFTQQLGGKPTDRAEINRTEAHLLEVRALSDLGLEASLQALERKEPEQTLRQWRGGLEP